MQEMIKDPTGWSLVLREASKLGIKQIQLCDALVPLSENDLAFLIETDPRMLVSPMEENRQERENTIRQELDNFSLRIKSLLGFSGEVIFLNKESLEATLRGNIANEQFKEQCRKVLNSARPIPCNTFGASSSLFSSETAPDNPAGQEIDKLCQQFLNSLKPLFDAEPPTRWLSLKEEILSKIQAGMPQDIAPEPAGRRTSS